MKSCAECIFFSCHPCLGPIEKECVNTLLSEALCLPPSLTRSLSTVVHSKTGGIIMFVLRFVASLNDEGDLWYSMSNRRWMYQIEDISVKEIHGDVVSHMTEVRIIALQSCCVMRRIHIIITNIPLHQYTEHEELVKGNANGVEGKSSYILKIRDTV